MIAIQVNCFTVFANHCIAGFLLTLTCNKAWVWLICDVLDILFIVSLFCKVLASNLDLCGHMTDHALN